jgi:thiopurine S-methyltransferase
MDKSFWMNRWAEGRIGFHQDQVHPDLLAHAPQLLGDTPQRVLVPLCGKTQDILWFAEQGHTVVGVELCDIAIRQWTEENQQQAQSALDRAQMHCGDILDLDSAELGQFDLIWDRAAMVALDPERRQRYARQLHTLLKPGGQLLINAFEYDQSLMDGPPHSVPMSEIKSLFPRWDCLLLRDEEIQAEGKFRERGVKEFRDTLAVLSA